MCQGAADSANELADCLVDEGLLALKKGQRKGNTLQLGVIHRCA